MITYYQIIGMLSEHWMNKPALVSSNPYCFEDWQYNSVRRYYTQTLRCQCGMTNNMDWWDLTSNPPMSKISYVIVTHATPDILQK